MEFLQLSETTRAREIDAELRKNKCRNEWLDPTHVIFFLFVFGQLISFIFSSQQEKTDPERNPSNWKTERHQNTQSLSPTIQRPT